MNLKMKDKDSISGTFEATQGERDVESGSYNEESNTLVLTFATEQFDVIVEGKLEKDQYIGTMSINDGAFEMDFTAERESKEQPSPSDEKSDDKPVEEKPAPQKQRGDESKKSDSKEKYEQPTGEGTLSALMPGPRWVSSIECSHFNKDRCYVTFDGHRSDDDKTYAFMTDDGGKSWKSILDNLPDNAGSARVIREDDVNQDLLFLGCEFLLGIRLTAEKPGLESKAICQRCQFTNLRFIPSNLKWSREPMAAVCGLQIFLCFGK